MGRLFDDQRVQTGRVGGQSGRHAATAGTDDQHIDDVVESAGRLKMQRSCRHRRSDGETGDQIGGRLVVTRCRSVGPGRASAAKAATQVRISCAELPPSWAMNEFDHLSSSSSCPLSRMSRNR